MALLASLILLVSPAGTIPVSSAPLPGHPAPKFSTAAAFNVSPTLRDLAQHSSRTSKAIDLPAERGPVVKDSGYTGDAALQRPSARQAPGAAPAPAIPASLVQDQC